MQEQLRLRFCEFAKDCNEGKTQVKTTRTELFLHIKKSFFSPSHRRYFCPLQFENSNQIIDKCETRLYFYSMIEERSLITV